MSADIAEINVSVRNFAPSGSTGELRTLAFGATGPIRVLIEVDFDEDAINLGLTLSNAAESDGIHAFVSDLIELLAVVNDSPDTIAALVAAEDKETTA
ncbi:hypothetical protein ACI7YT_12610 [Microbacterium sp. M]|uniref:hypothetical protein n=1 Tax=Microbacterium sp. M TaxID=3377125 RepID=UPI00386F1E28